MENLLPVRELSPVARELLSMFVISREERTKLIDDVADLLTYEATQELTVKIIDKTVDYQEQSLADKTLWLVRNAYLEGFAKGINNFSRTIETEVRKGKGVIL